MKIKRFAEVYWTYRDIQELRPKWTPTQCRNFLDAVQERLRCNMIQHGWEYLQEKVDLEKD